MYSANINCPQCGNALPLNFRHTKLAVCDHCDSTIFLEDNAVRLTGKRSVLPDLPSLLQLKTPFTYRGATFLPVGHIRYRYELGFWDEWWVLDGKGEGHWLSVDEGDFAFEKRVKAPASATFEAMQLGRKLDKWLVTERGQAVCEGFAGELPEVIEVGETFDYVHLSGALGELLTLEFTDDGALAYQGRWVDPFDIKVDV